MPKYRIDGEIYEAATPEEAYRQHAKKISPGMISGVAQQFTQGISLGGADELLAAAEAAAGGDYRASLKRQRREIGRAHV